MNNRIYQTNTYFKKTSGFCIDNVELLDSQIKGSPYFSKRYESNNFKGSHTISNSIDYKINNCTSGYLSKGFLNTGGYIFDN